LKPFNEAAKGNLMALVRLVRTPRLKSAAHLTRSAYAWLLSAVAVAMACGSQERPYAADDAEGGSGGEGAKPANQAGTSSGESGSSGEGNACSPNPCEHAGTCTPLGDAFECECTGGYSGERCEVVPGPCVDEPCENGGACTADADSFDCECADGFEGETCGTNIDDCSPNPCKNGGTCSDRVNRFECQCGEGWAGDTCSAKRFEALPMLEGASACYVSAVNGNGSVAVGTCVVGGLEQAFWWKPSMGTVALTYSNTSSANGVSHDGAVVVGSAVDGNDVACAARWVNGSGTCFHGFDHGDGYVRAYGMAVADDGELLIGYSLTSSDDPRGVRWENEEPVSLGDGFGEIYARAVSGDGTVVAGRAIDPDMAAIRWTLEGGWKALPIGDEIYAAARGISHDGKVIVGEINDEAARWVGISQGELLGLPGLALSANEDGSVIVGYSGAAAMIWVEGEGARLVADVIYELDPSVGTGWTLSSAEAISADGHVIAGNGTLDGVERVWLARR
jgi:uncharacterized membrane protein